MYTIGDLVDFLDVCSTGALGGNLYFDGGVLKKNQKKKVFGNISGFVKYRVSFFHFFICYFI